ncbi:hypothetical protein Tco_0026992 [Tanacetum coccineum]
MEKDLACPLLVGRGFLATASAVIDCKKSKIAVGERVTRSIFGVKEIGLGYEDTPWTTIARRKSYEPQHSTNDIGVQPPYNLEKDFMDNYVPEECLRKCKSWNKPPKEGDGAWHIRIELIDPDGEKFERIFQSIPTTRKLSEKQKPSDILDLEHFCDS